MTQPRERKAITTGSYDPPTLGHLDIIERAAGLFDHLVVGVLQNPAKRPTLDRDRRVELLRGEIAARDLQNVDVRAFEGLAVHFAESVGAGWIVRGLRSGVDLDFEWPMALSNRAFSASSVETVFLPARPELAHVKGQLVREIAAGGGDLGPFVSPAVEKALRERLESGS